MNLEPLVFTTRETSGEPAGPPPRIDDPAVENVHLGSVAVMSVDGGLTHWVGDPHWHTFTRSSLKPFQALSFVREGGPGRFGWGSREIALMCASHSGEAMHTDVVRTMLATSGCDVAQLKCGCQVPGWYAATGTPPPPDARGSEIEHNCSGKHAGFLAASVLHGEDPAGYLDPSSPLQRRVASAVAGLAGMAAHDMARGTDGCSAPNYALPLSRLALMYARLAQGSAAPEEGEALGVLCDAMTGHPDLVSGTARSDLALMSFASGDWVTKIGADGVQAIGIRSAGIGIAIKVADGSRTALLATVLEVLRQLELLPERVDDRHLLPGYRTELHNAAGLVTGRLVPAFKLRKA